MSIFASPSFYYGGGVFYGGTGAFFAGSGLDKLVGLDFYRTDTDNLYVFHWLFNQAFYSPALKGLDFQLQIDTHPDFSSPLTFETTTIPVNIIQSGYSRSAQYASINISAGETLQLNIDGDGAQTIILALNNTGTAIAADIQAKVRALTANTPTNQPAYNNFTATFNGAVNQYTLTSGSTGIGSTVVVTGGTAAPLLLLGLANGGYEVRGNSTILIPAARRVLFVETSTGLRLTDVSPQTNTPGPNQYIVSIATNQVTFNNANVPDTMSITYVAATSEDIIQFQRGNVARGFSVFVYDRIDSARETFYARVCIKSGASFGPYSDPITVQTLADVTKESADRLLQALPDRHVYPIDESYKPLDQRTKNISKVYWGYAVELDRFYLEKENAIRDLRQTRMRDPRLYGILGSRFGYSKPDTMEFVDYRIVVSNTKEAVLDGGTYNAIKLIGRAFTGVDPTILPFSQLINFITADETLSIETKTIPLSGPFTATLSEGYRKDPIIPGSLYSGPVTSVSEPHTIPVIPGPYTVVLAQRPQNIPSISGYTFTIGIPASGEFAVNYATKTLTFNSAQAGNAITVVYLPDADVTGGTLQINIDGDGIQTITLDGPFASKQEIADNIQLKVRALTANTPSNQPAYDNFIALYSSAADQYTLISGNQNPTSASSVIVSGGTAAAPLNLTLITGAVQSSGIAYKTPPGAPASGQFRSNIDTGDGSLLTFNAAQSNQKHTILYKKKSTIFTYTPHTTTDSLTVSASSPYIVTLSALPIDIPSIPGFTYTTGTPAVSQFTVNFSTGVLTFNAANASTPVNVSYTASAPTPPILYGKIEAGFSIKIILNNPAAFPLDLTNISFLLKEILPAHTKFVLV